jgi:hypothetical protein
MQILIPFVRLRDARGFVHFIGIHVRVPSLVRFWTAACKHLYIDRDFTRVRLSPYQ